MMPIRTGLPLRGITTFRTRGRPGLIDGGVAIPLVRGDGAGCPPGPGRDRLHGWGQLWCIRRVPGLHVVVQDDAVVVVDSLPLVPELDRHPMANGVKRRSRFGAARLLFRR